jgi:ABC-2 type transport system ATP-binding protein
MTVKQIFDYHESFYEKDLSKRREELVKLFKIDESKKLEDLSLGNSKKVGIVLALMHEPELLILDEPCSGLDVNITKEFYNTLSKLNQENGLTIIMATHDLDEVENDNARVICMATDIKFDGNIVKWREL